jgi:hypothetical protein
MDQSDILAVVKSIDTVNFTACLLLLRRHVRDHQEKCTNKDTQL